MTTVENSQELELDETQIHDESVETEEVSDDSVTEDETIDWKAEALKQKAINKRINARKEAKKEPAKKEESTGLSNRDILTLAKADIHEDDLDEVLDYARFKDISIAEALKSPVIKTTLSTNDEYRKTAAATNTGSNKRSTTKVSDQQLLANASKGILPAKGSADAERLFMARRGR